MAFVIPTFYTAVDKVTAVTQRIAYANEVMARDMQIAWKRVMPEADDALKRRFQFMASMGKAMAVVGTGLFAGKSIIEYEKAVASFRTIVSDLSETDFSEFKKKITEVAYATSKGTVEVAQSFEKIAGLNPEFARTAEGLGLVSKAAITLAKASSMELAPATENLVGIMNQMGLSADQADRVINALAAGQAVGAASISQTAEAMTNFGASAKSANVSLEQSVALVQTLAKYGQLGADAGDKLRTSFIRIQQTGFGYKSGKFDIVDALTEMKARYDSLGSSFAKDDMLAKVFGATQIITGQILLKNIDLFKQFTKEVTGTSEAQKAADINSRTLANRAQELANKFQTIVTTSKNVGMGVELVTSAIGFLTSHMEGLLTLATLVAGSFVAVRGSMLLMTMTTKAFGAAMAVVNYVMGIATVVNGQYATSCFATTAGMNGMATAAFFLEMGLWGSIGVIGVAAAALATLTNGFGTGYDSAITYVEGLKKTKAGLYELSKPLTDAQIKIQQYNAEMEKFHELQNYEGYLKTKSFMGKVFEPIVNPILYQQYKAKTLSGLVPLSMSAPTPQEYGIDSTGNEISNFTKPSSNTQVVKHMFTIELQDNGKTVKTIDSASLTPTVKSTATYQ